MDPAAFAALVERCAPTEAMVKPLTEIVRQASSFEPLLITISGRKPIPIQPTDSNEAIQLLAEALATGQPVRSGLAQLDGADTKKAGLTPTTTFDVCKHIAGLGRLFEERLRAAKPIAAGRDQAIAYVTASFATPATAARREPSPIAVDSAASPASKNPAPDPSIPLKERSDWDVYRTSRGTSAFVYDR